ncbi:MAG: 3'-5' exonuclease [Candidatus Sungbacteria bacterium]|uniref:3'-5' exonuclease n=1 Tax=Candidatus Sungiibacteriota bacterium TaxID=2750080 RepID=A0A931YD80_9BACT|nr:3'-5' exonuclease [Candidatus Sungbacteria bacterium]
MEFTKRPLAITDVETTGLDYQLHEIIEIGLILADQKTLKILDEWSVKVKPRKIKTAAEAALKVAGYNKLDWLNAVTLKEAMEAYSKKTKNAIFVAQNSFFDWSFLSEAFKQTGVEDHIDYHRVDLFTIGWSKAKELKRLKKFTLKEMCRYFNIEPEPVPHRAPNGARKAREILIKLQNI